MQQIARAASHTTVAIALAAIAGCSSSNPAGPSPSPGGGFDPEQFLRPGEYRLLAVSPTQQTNSCSGSQTPNPFFAFAAALNLTRDGETWTARAKTEADGDMELRLRRVRDDSVAGSRVLIIAVEGTGRGTANAIGSGTTQTFSFVGESRLEGRALFQGSAQGTATGAIRVDSAIFGSFECSAVSWTLVPATAPPF